MISGGSADLQDHLPQNYLFDEFRRRYDMAYDLQFEGLQHLPPQSATGTL
jgi:hypothetical protein